MTLSTAKVHFEGRCTAFFVDNENDHIQRHHVRGNFYEIRQLLLHRDLIPMKTTVLDVGANVGNHTLFYAKYTYATLVYPFEPNERARQLLLRSLSNEHDCRAKVATDYVDFALGRSAGLVTTIPGSRDNLGATKVIATCDAEIANAKCTALDDLELKGDVSFLKVDVEGMELDVLVGASKLVAKHRPTIAVEIQKKHEQQFWQWISQNRYQVIAAFFDYLNVKNYVAIAIT